jgi:hypothetical protein
MKLHHDLSASLASCPALIDKQPTRRLSKTSRRPARASQHGASEEHNEKGQPSGWPLILEKAGSPY